MTETDIREIVRNELGRILRPGGGPVDVVAAFLRTLSPGEVSATELYEMFGRFHPDHGLSQRGFALRALRTGLVTRRTARTGRVYAIAGARAA